VLASGRDRVCAGGAEICIVAGTRAGSQRHSSFIDLPNLYEPSRVEATLAVTVHGGILAWAGRSVFGFMRNGSGGTVAPSDRAAITKRPKTAAACAVVTGAYMLLMQFLRT
jgi:hypothetical protein